MYAEGNAPIRYEIRNADLFLPFLRVIEGYHTKGFFPGSESKDIADMYVDLKLYRAVPVKSMMEVVTLSKETREVISNISAPSLIIQSEKDTLVDPYSSVFIFSRINNPDKKIVLLSESSHINFSKKDQDIALNEIGKFIKN